MKYRKWIIVGVAVAAVAAFFVLDLGRYFSLDYVKSVQGEFTALYEQNPVLVIGVYAAIYIVAFALALPVGAVISLAGGALFGLVVGTLVVSFASSIGATLAFLASRYVLSDTVRRRFGNRMAEVDRGVAREGAFYLFTLRLIPAIPPAAINLLFGLTSMKTITFYWVSQLGMLAGTIVYVNAGTQLAQIESLSGIVSPGLIVSFVLLGVFPLIARRIVEAVKSRRVYARWADRKPRSYDRNMVVIGAGSAGLVTAYIAAAVKAKVTLVEGHKMGGDCLNTGCVPSKALIKTATLVRQMRHGADYGIVAVERPAFDFAQVMERVAGIVRAIEPHDSVERYTDLGVDVRIGRATIVDPWHVRIDRDDGASETLSTRSIVIATGARPAVPPLPGLDDVGYLTSDTMWELRELPARLVVLGGGPIGCELAQAFARLGSAVTQVEMGDRLMAREDPEVSDYARQALQADGVTVLTGHKALRCEAAARDGEGAGGDRVGSASDGGGGKSIVVETGGREVRIGFDVLLVAVGRAARLDGIGLEALGIPAKRTVGTDEFLRTNYPNILAAGDVAGPFQFTHTASHQAWYAAVNGLFGGFKSFKADYSVIPWCTFIDPEVARVGLNEQDAREQGIDFEVTRYGIDDSDRAIADSSAHGWVKVLTVPGKDTILGVTIVGVHAGDLIAEFVLAMKHKIGLNKILGTIHIYPTLAEMNKAVAGNWKRAHQPDALLRWVEKFHGWRRG